MRISKVLVAIAFASGIILTIGSRPVIAAGNSSPEITCLTTGCGTPIPRPTATLRPTPTPIPKTPPGSQDASPGYGYSAGFAWYLTYLDSYAEVQPYGMTSNYPTDSISFSTNELWRFDGTDSNAWQEIGYVIGLLNGNYFNGLFGAFQEPATGYVEFAIQSTPPSNDPNGEDEVGVSLAVQSSNNRYVDFNYNGTTYNTDGYGESGTSAVSVVGIESHSSTASFNSFGGEVDVSDPQVLTSSSSSWTTWPSSPSQLSYILNDPPNDVYCGWANNVEPSGTEPLVACYHR